MIICADLNMFGNAHVPINSSLLKMISNIFNEDKILFIAEKEHLEKVKGNVDCYNINYIEKINPFSNSGFQIFLKEVLECINFLKILYLYKKDKANLIVIFSMFSLTHYFIKLIKILLPEVNILVVLHGELEYMREKKRLNIRLFGLILKKALILKNDVNMYYLVLGKVIKKNLLEYLNMEEKSIITIDHPYEYSNIVNKNVDFEHIKIATIGVATKAKNTQFIFKLGEALNRFIIIDKLNLSIIGILDKSVVSYTNDNVSYLGSNSLLDRSAFEMAIQKIDYAVFFYDNNYYKMCASGAFFDAIKFEKPIIAIKNDFFNYYFNILGNIGYLCDDYNQLEKKIVWIVNNRPSEEYQIQVNNLQKAKEILSLVNIEKCLKNEIDKIFRFKSE